MKKFLLVVLYSLLFITILLFTSCASTTCPQLSEYEKDRIQNVKFSVKAINDWNYEITGLDDVNNVYILRARNKKSKKDMQEYLAYLNNNISIESHGVKYAAKFLDYDKIKYYYNDQSAYLYIEKYQLCDINEKPLTKSDMITIKQNRRAKKVYSDSVPIVSPYIMVQRPINNEILTLNNFYDAIKFYGREENYTDCYILLKVLDGDTKKEGEKKDLAEKIINKKYPDYYDSQNRTSFKYLINSLQFKTKVPYKKDDWIVTNSYLLEIKHMSRFSNGFVYLVTILGTPLSIGQCCEIVSNKEIEYVPYDGCALILNSLNLRYLGKDEYQKGYHIEECDLFSLMSDNDPILVNYKNIISDVKKILKNPENYKSILEN